VNFILNSANMLVDLVLIQDSHATLVGAGLVLLVTWALRYIFSQGSKLPIINEKSILEFGLLSSKKGYVSGAATLIKDGFAKVCLISIIYSS
jgi:hypothetical protein